MSERPLPTAWILVELAQRCADVPVSDQLVLSISRVLLTCPASDSGRLFRSIAELTCEYGESRPYQRQHLPKDSAGKLLHRQPGAQRRFLMPGSDPPAR